MAPRKITILSFALYSALSGAQETSNSLDLPTPAATPIASETKTEIEKPQAAERVEVTGSHIKRVDVEGASPVQTITRKDMEKTGYNSVSDVMRDTTANSFGSMREDSGSGAAGVAHVDLRGLGSSNTLVLLNGQRLPSDAVTGAVDLNLIPMAAVERVEVLKDGASATYGSDALGGVVNIITRKDFSGNEIALSQSTPELAGGKRQEISLVNGINKGRFNMVNVLQYRDNETIFSRDRDWTNKGYSMTGKQPAYRGQNGQWIASPNCEASSVEHTPQGDFCKVRFSDYSTELPALQQLSVLSESNVELNAKVRLKARAGYTQKKVQWSYAPSPGTFQIPANVHTGLGPGGTPLPGADPNQPLTVRYRLMELGTRDTEIETNAYNALVGTTVQVTENWEAEVNVSHNQVDNRDEGINGYALTSALNQAIASGQFNPFAPDGQKGSLDNTRYNPLQVTRSQLSSLDAKISGPITEMSAGPLSMALGTNFTFQKYSDVSDEKTVNGEIFGAAGSSGGGQRDTKAAFTEFSIPVTKKLELQLAGRYDQYSDFGDTVNPKMAFLYHATPNLLFRASAGTGFKAPLMQDLYASDSLGFPTAIDAVACRNERAAGGATPSCTPQQYEARSGGNKGLKEEKSISYTTGMIYAPTANFSFGSDLFLTKLNNVVGIDYDDVLQAEADHGANGQAYLKEHGVNVIRDANGYIERIEAPLQNLSAKQISGIDITSSYRISKVTLGVDHSHIFEYREEGFPGAGMKNKLGKDEHPAWRNTVSVGYAPADRHNISVDAQTTAGYEKAVAEMGRLPNYTTYGMQYNYKSKKLGTFTAGISNLLGTTPPLDDSGSTRTFNNTLYDQIGRQVFTGYKATF